MYAVSIQNFFTARHYLAAEEGNESQPHNHSYTIQITLSGKILDDKGYLVNLLDLREILKELTSRFRNQLLNDLAEFDGINPSLENFARIMCESFTAQLKAPNVMYVAVRLWESADSWASYRKEI